MREVILPVVIGASVGALLAGAVGAQRRRARLRKQVSAEPEEVGEVAGGEQSSRLNSQTQGNQGDQGPGSVAGDFHGEQAPGDSLSVNPIQVLGGRIKEASALSKRAHAQIADGITESMNSFVDNADKVAIMENIVKQANLICDLYDVAHAKQIQPTPIMLRKASTYLTSLKARLEGLDVEKKQFLFVNVVQPLDAYVKNIISEVSLRM